MAERRGRTIRVADAIRDLVSAADSGGGLKRAQAVEAWPEVAGAEIARRTLGVGLRGGELTVQVESHAWATELSVLSEELRERLNSALGEEAVRAIRFTVSRSVSEARATAHAEASALRRYGGEPVQPHPLTPDEVAEIEEQASVIEHEGVREAAVRAQIRDRGLKKARTARERGEGCGEVEREAPREVARGHREPQDLW